MKLQNHFHSSLNLFLLNRFIWIFGTFPAGPKSIRVPHYLSSFVSGVSHNTTSKDLHNESAVSPTSNLFVKGGNSFTTASIHQRFYILGLDASISYYPKLYLLRSNVDLPRNPHRTYTFKSRLTRLRLPAIYINSSISLFCYLIISFLFPSSLQIILEVC